MTNKTKSKIIKVSSTGLCVGAPLVATLMQFPVWVQHSSESTMSCMFIFLAFLCCIPFIRQIKAYLKSPASWFMWTLIGGIMLAIRSIIDQMIIICIVGAISNVMGAILFHVAKKVEEKEDKPKEQVEGNG